MAHRLGLRFGASPVTLMETMSGAEFDDWCDYYSREPWGIEAMDILFANLCMTIVNMFAKFPHKLHEFLCFNRRRIEPVDGEVLRQRAMQMVKALGGEILPSIPNG